MVDVRIGVIVIYVDQVIEISAGGEILSVGIKEIRGTGSLEGADIIDHEPLMLAQNGTLRQHPLAEEVGISAVEDRVAVGIVEKPQAYLGTAVDRGSVFGAAGI